MILSDLSESEIGQRLRGDGLQLRTGPFVCALRTPIASVTEGIARLYADFPLAEGCDFADFHIHIRPRGGLRGRLSRTAIFSLDGYFHFDPFPLSMSMAYFEWGLNCCISRNVFQYLSLHGAVVERDGRALVVLGESGAGKSTLCCALVADGWRLLSDELTLISPRTLEITPLARPISLKNESIDLIRGLLPQAEFGPASHGSIKGTVAHLRPPRESVARVAESALPSRFVFVEYVPGNTTAELREVPPALAHMRIAAQGFNYGILGQSGFDTLGRVVERSKTFDLRYGDLKQVRRLLASDEFLHD